MPDTATYAVRKPVVFVSVAVAIIILGLNAALVFQNQALKEKLAKPAPSLLPPVGNLSPPLEGLDSTGSRIVISYNTPKSKTLLFIFSPGCELCSENWPNWTTISHLAETTSARITYVNPVGPVPPDYLSRRGVFTNFVAQVDPKSLVSYNLRYTPETLLLDGSGKIMNVWAGVLDAADLKEIERLLAQQIGSREASPAKAIQDRKEKESHEIPVQGAANHSHYTTGLYIGS